MIPSLLETDINIENDMKKLQKKENKSLGNNREDTKEEILNTHNYIEENNKFVMKENDLINKIDFSTNKDSKNSVSVNQSKKDEKAGFHPQDLIERNEIKYNIINDNDDPIETLKKEIKALKEKIQINETEINNLKEGNSKLSKRVEKLEINQLLLYHQIYMYQTLGDMFESIYYYYFKYLDLKQFCLNNFEKLREIIKYLEETDDIKSKEMTRNKKDEKIPQISNDFKMKLANYFKLHFFLSKVSNKIVQRNFSEEQKCLLKTQKDKDLLPLIPDFDFEQSFDTLEYYIENSINNNQIKAAMEIVYDEKYIKDDKLGPVKDSDNKVVKKGQNGIQILMDKKDIEEVKNYFKNIKIDNKSFVKLCNDKLWDQEDL